MSKKRRKTSNPLSDKTAPVSQPASVKAAAPVETPVPSNSSPTNSSPSNSDPSNSNPSNPASSNQLQANLNVASTDLPPGDNPTLLSKDETTASTEPLALEIAPTDLENADDPELIYEPTWSEQLGELVLEYKWWLFGLVMLLAAGLRLWRLDYRSIWYDESFSLTLASRDLATLLSGTANDYHPPLYYILLGGWTRLLGDNVYSGRLLSALAGVGFVAVVYGLAKELFGSRTALLAALFAAVAPFQILYAQEVRHYSLQALLGTATVWAFYRAWRRGGWLYWGLFALAWVLSLYNLYFSIFGLLLINLFFVAAILDRRRTSAGWDWPRIKGWVGANLAIGLLYAPWALVLIQRVGQVQKSYWIDKPNPLEFFRLTNVFLVNATNLTTDPLWTVSGLLLGTLVTVFLLNALRFRLRRGEKGQHRRSFEVALLMTVWLGVVLLVLAISYLFAPIYLERSLLGVSALFYILLARVIQTARRPAFWLLLIVPGLVVLLGSLYFYYFSADYTTHYENEQALAHLRASYRQGDLTLHSSKLSYQPFAYLKAPGPQFLAPEEPGNIHDDLSAPTLTAIGMSYTPVPQALAQVPANGRVWLVRTDPQPGQTAQYLDSIQQQIATRYTLSEKWEYRGGILFLYTPAKA